MFENFIEEYKRQLTIAITNYPEDYAYDVSEVPEFVEKMKEALKNRNYSKDGRAMKETCKFFNIKPTYKEINNFLEKKCNV